MLVACHLHDLYMSNSNNEELVRRRLCSHILEHKCLLTSHSKGLCPHCEEDPVRNINEYQTALLRDVMSKDFKNENWLSNCFCNAPFCCTKINKDIIMLTICDYVSSLCSADTPSSVIRAGQRQRNMDCEINN